MNKSKVDRNLFYNPDFGLYLVLSRLYSEMSTLLCRHDSDYVITLRDFRTLPAGILL
jgi:hypothetical protein